MNSPVNISGNTQSTSNRGGIGRMLMGQTKVKGGVINGDGTGIDFNLGARVSVISGTTLESGKAEDQISAVQTSTAKLLSQVSDFLPDGERLSAGEKAREFQKMMGIFVSDVEKLRERFGYGYNGDDYTKRLVVSDDEFKRVFERILRENTSLYEGYRRLLENYTGDREKFKKRLMKEHGEDLVYEGMKKGEYSNDQSMGTLSLQRKSAEEVKEMVVGFAGEGGEEFGYRK